MITVESILEDNAKEQAKTAKNNEEILTSGSTSKSKKRIWPYVAGIVVLGFVAYWLFFRKKGEGSNNEGMVGS
jgi:hypothetical protein